MKGSYNGKNERRKRNNFPISIILYTVVCQKS